LIKLLKSKTLETKAKESDDIADQTCRSKSETKISLKNGSECLYWESDVKNQVSTSRKVDSSSEATMNTILQVDFL